jgi:hypothetical protein
MPDPNLNQQPFGRDPDDILAELSGIAKSNALTNSGTDGGTGQDQATSKKRTLINQHLNPTDKSVYINEMYHYQGTRFYWELYQKDGRWHGHILIQNRYEHSKDDDPQWGNNDDPEKRKPDTQIMIDVSNNNLTFEEQSKVIKTFFAKINAGRPLTAQAHNHGFIHGANTMRDILVPIETNGKNSGVLALDKDFDFNQDASWKDANGKTGMGRVIDKLISDKKLILAKGFENGTATNPFIDKVQARLEELNQKYSDGSWKLILDKDTDFTPFGRFNNKLVASVISAAYADYDFTIKKVVCRDHVPVEVAYQDREGKTKSTTVLAAGFNSMSYYLDDDGHVSLIKADRQLPDNKLYDLIQEKEKPLVRLALGQFTDRFANVEKEFLTIAESIAQDQKFMDDQILASMRADNPG